MEEINIEDIILNLKLISKIKQNDKMLIINKVIQVDTRFLQPIWRWYTSDNRTETFNFITMIVNKGIEYSSSKERISENELYTKENVNKDLKLSLVGLENLGATYKNDILISSKIDLLKDKITRVCN